MIRSAILLFLLAFGITATAQDTLVLRYDDSLRLTADTTAPNTGILIRQGDTWSATIFSNATGNRLMTGYYAADHRTEEGPFDYYLPEGSVFLHGYFHEGKKFGTWKQWDPLGRLTDSIYFNEDAILAEALYRYSEKDISHPESRITSYNFVDHRNEHRLLKSFTITGQLSSISEWWGRKGEIKVYNEEGALAKYTAYDSTGKKIKNTFYDRSGRELDEEAYKKMLADNVPEFKGGRTAFQHYFDQNMKAKAVAMSQPNSSVVVTVSFLLDEQGRATNVNVLEYSDLAWQQAAIDFFRSMPNWDMKGHKIWGPLVYTFRLNF